jgi:predicted aspartyl protease
MYNYKVFGRKDDYAAPHAELNVIAAEGEFEPLSIDALLDTGADFTAVPPGLLPLSLTRTSKIATTGAGNVNASVYVVHTRMGDCHFQRHEVWVLQGLPHAVIGRDILCKFELSLNGPKEEWSMAPTRGSWDMDTK